MSPADLVTAQKTLNSMGATTGTTGSLVNGNLRVASQDGIGGNTGQRLPQPIGAPAAPAAPTASVAPAAGTAPPVPFDSPDALQRSLVRASDQFHQPPPISIPGGDPAARAWNRSQGTGRPETPDPGGVPATRSIFDEQPGLLNRPDVAAYIKRHGMDAAVAKAAELSGTNTPATSPGGGRALFDAQPDPRALAAAGTGNVIATPYGTASSTTASPGAVQSTAVVSDTGVTHPQVPQTTQDRWTQTHGPDWQKRIVNLYPNIGVAGTPENQAFVAAAKSGNNKLDAFDTASAANSTGVAARAGLAASGAASGGPVPQSPMFASGDPDPDGIIADYKARIAQRNTEQAAAARAALPPAALATPADAGSQPGSLGVHWAGGGRVAPNTPATGSAPAAQNPLALFAQNPEDAAYKKRLTTNPSNMPGQ